MKSIHIKTILDLIKADMQLALISGTLDMMKIAEIINDTGKSVSDRVITNDKIEEK